MFDAAFGKVVPSLRIFLMKIGYICLGIFYDKNETHGYCMFVSVCVHKTMYMLELPGPQFYNHLKNVELITSFCLFYSRWGWGGLNL